MPTPSRLLIPGTVLPCLALLLGATRATAQTARLEGTVTDSLRRRPLAGALVQVGQVSRRFVTDSAGRFHADSLPAGPQQVRFTHAVLDSLGMRGAPVTVELQPGATAQVALGTPSGRTFLTRLCPDPGAAARQPDGRSAVLGVVRAADSDEPIAGAAVQLQWASVIVDRVLGLRRQVEVQNAVTDSTGLYLVCHTPGDLEAALTIAAAGYDTAAAELHLADGAAAVQHVMLAASAAPGVAGVAGVAAVDASDASDASAATLTGTVRDEEGRPLDGAEVVIVTRHGRVTHGPARTDAAGRFVLRHAPPGTRLVEVRRIGATPVRRTVSLASGRPTRLDVTLTARAVVLADVTVKGETPLDRNGFTLRRGIGQGRFYIHDDIARRNVTVASDLLDQLPDLQVDGSRVVNRSRRQNTTGATCEIATFLDGVLTPADFVLEIPRAEIAGVELYPVAGNVPLEFVRPETSCGAILIWTTRAR